MWRAGRGLPWAEPWARVTTALANAVAVLARELSWQGVARQYGLNWKSVATIVKRAVRYGLEHRVRRPVHVIGIDEVSRRKGQVYLTVVYDLERRVLLWVGEDRTEEAVRKFFTEEMGRRRCHTLQVVCMDMWAPFAKLVKDHAPQAQLLFDRFHIVKHLNEAVDAVRRQLWRRVTAKEKVAVKGTRWLLLKNPWNLNDQQKERLSTLVRWNTPLVPRLVPQGGLPTVLGVPAAQARPGFPGEVDALSDEVPPGAVQEIRGDASIPLGRCACLDQSSGFQRSRRGNEQQDQIHQPSLVRFPHRGVLHCGYLSLLRSTAPPSRTLITLLGNEPKQGRSPESL